MQEQDFFLGRQPILDRNGQLFAFELLFRTGNHGSVDVADDVAATSSVIHFAFSEMGVQDVLGQYRGFINVSHDVLHADLIEILPASHVVLELLETILITPAVVARCTQLKARGFLLALDDVVAWDESYRALLPFIDFVKLDVLAIPAAELANVVRAFIPFKAQLLAEKVENLAQFETCKALGFDLFQGYYFAKPAVLQGKRADPSQLALLNLLSLVMRDADSPEIEKAFKAHPNLALNLMRLVNSVASGVTVKISSLQQAITILGRQQLRRWLQILVFTVRSDGTPQNSPLMQLATTRGRFMETLSSRLGQSRAAQDQAFMVGILSLLDALFNLPMESLIPPLNLSEPVQQALLNRHGELGQMLKLIEATERADALPEQAMHSLGARPDQVMAAEIEAMEWTNHLM